MNYDDYPCDPTILLHPNIPKPLHLVAPRTVLGEAWWKSVKKKVKREANGRCQACGILQDDALFHPWLECHEIYKIDYKAGTANYEKTVAICHACHNYIHSGRMQALVDKGEMDEFKMKLILESGDRLLKLAKLKKPRDPSDCAPWEKWRMVIFGVEYGRKFDTFKDWAKHFGYPIRQMDEYDYLDDDDDPFGSDTIEWGDGIMKQTPLKRKTPLKRGLSQLRSRKPMKQVSKRRQKEGSEYSRLRKEFLLEKQACFLFGLRPGCTHKATQVHHAAKRGMFYLRVDTWRQCCRECHDWAEKNRKDAEKIGMTFTIEQIRKLREAS